MQGRCHAFEALRRYYKHLEPGGVLAIDCYHPDAVYWKKKTRAQLPQPWPSIPPPEERLQLADGTRMQYLVRVVDFDPWEVVITREIRGLQWRDGQLVKEETYTLKEGAYSKNEMLMMLESPGFRDIQIQGGHTTQTPSPEHECIVFLAKKPH